MKPIKAKTFLGVDELLTPELNIKRLSPSQDMEKSTSTFELIDRMSKNGIRHPSDGPKKRSLEMNATKMKFALRRSSKNDEMQNLSEA